METSNNVVGNENEESYLLNIVINQQQQMYGNIYGTNYNILKIMSGLVRLNYSN